MKQLHHLEHMGITAWSRRTRASIWEAVPLLDNNLEIGLLIAKGISSNQKAIPLLINVLKPLGWYFNSPPLDAADLQLDKGIVVTFGCPPEIHVRGEVTLIQLPSIAELLGNANSKRLCWAVLKNYSKGLKNT